MPDPEKFEIEPNKQVADQNTVVTLPPELAGKTSAEIYAMVAVEKTKTDEANKARERAEAIAQEIAIAAMDGRRVAPEVKQAPAAIASAEPDREEDPAGWTKWTIEKQVSERLKPIVDSYTRDRQIVMGSAYEAAKARVASLFPDFASYEKELTEFTRNYSPDVLAQPGALEEAYYRVKGRVQTQKDQETRVREQASIETRGRVGVESTKVAEPKLTDEQLRISTNLGVDPTGFRILEGAGSVSIDEFLAAKAAITAKSKGGANAAR